MIRRAAAVVLALALNPALVRAQDTVFTVSVPSADVYKGPSTGTPVVGHVSRGTVLPISRNLGSWIKIAWPQAPDGVGYVHITMGHIGPAGANTPAVHAPQSTPSSTASTAPAAAPKPAATTSAPAARASVSQPATRRPLNVTPAEHTFGVGGLLGTMSTWGASARTWVNPHVGVQVGFTRDAMNNDVGDSRMTSMQFEPGAMYGFFDRVSDYVWIRPYVGSVVSFRHQTLTGAAQTTPEAASDNELGFRFFGGSEFMFSSAPRLGLSADVGYHRLPTLPAGFEASPLSLTIAGHWFIK